MGEWLLLLLFLFPEGPVGQPAPGAAVFRYVPDDALFVAGGDLASWAQGIDQQLGRLQKLPFLQEEPWQQALLALSMGRQALLAEIQKMNLGLDPFLDIRFASLVFGEDPLRRERVLLTLGGNFSKKSVEAFANIIEAKAEGEHWTLPRGEGRQWLAQDSRGNVLVGDSEWVQQALKGPWVSAAFKPLLQDYDPKTFLLIAFRPTPIIKSMMQQLDPMVRPLASHLQAISIRLTYGGSSLKLVLDDVRFVRIWRDLLDGLGQMMSAFNHGSNGFLTMAEAYLASLDPAAALDIQGPPQQTTLIRSLVAHRSEFKKLLQDMMLGPPPRIKLSSDDKARSVQMQIEGRGGAGLMILPGMASWLFLARSTGVSAPVPTPEMNPPSQTPTALPKR